MHELDSWRGELRSAYLYRVVAQTEAGTTRAALFFELANEAEKQAQIWRNLLEKRGAAAPAYRPDFRTRLLAALVRRFGVRALKPALAAMKVRGMSLYSAGAPSGGAAHGVEAEGRRHQGLSGGGNLRAAVFGVNDGLVSNASLILGVAGAAPDNSMVVLSGVAGLVAGACSMAAGEYVSVRSQREFYEYQIELERAELGQYPDEEAEELALIYAARGMAKQDARRMAQQIVSDPTRALDTLAREELGLNPDALGSPWGAAIASFVSFAAGALVPLLPFFLARGSTALVAAIALSAVALTLVGASLSLFTGRPAWLSALRMLAIGAAAGAVTFGVGKLIGVSVS